MPEMEMNVTSCETGDHDWEMIHHKTRYGLYLVRCVDCHEPNWQNLYDFIAGQIDVNLREMRHLSVYRCGLGGDVWRAWRALRIGMGWKAARGELRKSTRVMGRWMRERNWRAVRMHLKGWMAEPYRDAGITWDQCGAGWTRKGAVRSFHRRQAKYWLYYHHTKRNDKTYQPDECYSCEVPR